MVARREGDRKEAAREDRKRERVPVTCFLLLSRLRLFHVYICIQQSKVLAVLHRHIHRRTHPRAFAHTRLCVYPFPSLSVSLSSFISCVLVGVFFFLPHFVPLPQSPCGSHSHSADSRRLECGGGFSLSVSRLFSPPCLSSGRTSSADHLHPSDRAALCCV